MMTISMQDVLPKWLPSNAVGHKGLTLIPLREKVRQQRFEDYLLTSEAIHLGVLSITEVGDSGSVPELQTINTGDLSILLIDGEELQGAKQNRILNTSIFLPPMSRELIPVSCVEEGRWDQTSEEFESGNYAPSSLRQQKSRDVQFNLREHGRAESDQDVVWDGVREHIEACNIQAPTGAMSDAMENRSEVLSRYQEALPCPADACGVVAAVHGQLIAVDVFDSPSTLKAIWPRLIASYAMDAEKSTSKSKRPKLFTAKAVEVLLEHIAQQQCQKFKSVGRGYDLRFEASTMLGQALYVEDRILHMSVFPTSTKPCRKITEGPHITPPSQRGGSGGERFTSE
ncbi:MAG: hypothetical protein JKX85_15130 [Phycisphaeraceae bacterium]|nr:hypothetical protein [Phycisphaeraceae bacterium]